jgi:hypothetical protein
VSDNDAVTEVDADVENAAALAQPAYPDENDVDDDADEVSLEVAPPSDEAPDEVRDADSAINNAATMEQSVTDDSVTAVPEDDDTTGQGQ